MLSEASDLPLRLVQVFLMVETYFESLNNGIIPVCLPALCVGEAPDKKLHNSYIPQTEQHEPGGQMLFHMGM